MSYKIPPLPSIDMENKASAIRFIQGNQKVYLKTYLEKIPKIIELNKNKLKSFKILKKDNPKDKQIINSVIFCKKNENLKKIKREVIKKGIGKLLGYGIYNKNKNYNGYLIRIDKYKNRFSPIVINIQKELKKVFYSNIDIIRNGGKIFLLKGRNNKNLWKILNLRKKKFNKLQKQKMKKYYVS